MSDWMQEYRDAERRSRRRRIAWAVITWLVMGVAGIAIWALIVWFIVSFG